MTIPVLPLTTWIENAIRWMQVNLGPFFDAIKIALISVDTFLRGIFLLVPPWAAVAVCVAVLIWRRRRVAAVGVGLALALIANLGLWRATTDTLALVALAAGLSVLIGTPLGILISESRIARAVVTPVLDYMQTTPAFVYLIPAVLFFGIGAAPGVLATAAFALPPVARAVALGLDEVSPVMIEAARAFGANRFQLLVKVKLPLAAPYFWLGINQSIMMSLSMIVICALIGARGLGVEVVTALTQMNLANGIEAGLAVVLLASTLDRMFVPPPRTRR
jgi:glycine betaine/proline transport system permease protein